MKTHRNASTPLEQRHSELTKNLGYARVDSGRFKRQGFPEAVFCPGKSTEQIIEIFSELRRNGGPAIATRLSPEIAKALLYQFPDAVYRPSARIVFSRPVRSTRKRKAVLVIAAGTSDLPVAEEASATLEALGVSAGKVFDVGVSGLHRLLAHQSELRRASVVVVCAGMDGALPSVVGGLVGCPVIAVPTSIGYGSHLNGIAPLLTMLNSCAANVSVVNIDNGFGAGVIASLISK